MHNYGPQIVPHLGSPLLVGCTDWWLPLKSLRGGGIFAKLIGARPAVLTGGPTWRETPYGGGVQTDDLKWIEVGGGGTGFEPSRNFTLFFAYVYRYDNSAATETGTLFGAGTLGVALRHYNGNLELLKSHTSSLLATAVSAANGEFHTAALTIGPAGTAAMTLFYDGRQISTVNSATTFTGQTGTRFGYDTANTAMDFGRHTFLGALSYEGRVLAPSHIYELHQAAKARWEPLFLQPLRPWNQVIAVTDTIEQELDWDGGDGEFVPTDVYDTLSQTVGWKGQFIVQADELSRGTRYRR